MKTGRKGASHPLARLQESDVMFIRSSHLSSRDCAEMFGVHIQTINDVRARRSWNHLPVSDSETRLKVADRFERAVIRTNGCWGWKRSVDHDGYPYLHGEIPPYGLFRRAHVISYVLHKGPIPAGLFVLHTCDNPSCTNPEHLYTGTAKQNALDRAQRGRNGNQNGERNGSSKLSDVAVKMIRTLPLTGTALAEIFGVSVSLISQVRNNQIWKHV